MNTNYRFIYTLLLILPFCANAESAFNGHRLGAGINHVSFNESFLGLSQDLNTGFKIEYGYDITNIFGFNTSYSMNSKNIWAGKYKLSSLKVDTDMGYAFDLDNVWIKPYGAIGLAFDREKYSHNNGNIDGSMTNLFVGVGVRAQISLGIYADLRYDLNDYEGIDVDIISLTLGYRF